MVNQSIKGLQKHLLCLVSDTITAKW